MNCFIFYDRCLRKLFVGGFPITTKNVDLRRHFEQYGKVSSCQINADKKRQNLGFGFVEFSTAKGCKKALEQARQEINGKMCNVESKRHSGFFNILIFVTTTYLGKKDGISSNSKESIDIRKLLAEKFGEPKRSNDSLDDNQGTFNKLVFIACFSSIKL